MIDRAINLLNEYEELTISKLDSFLKLRFHNFKTNLSFDVNIPLDTYKSYDCLVNDAMEIKFQRVLTSIRCKRYEMEAEK